MSQKLIVLELNEVPLRLLHYYAEKQSDSSIAHLLNHSLVIKTLATDVEIDDLYPSQTWASLNPTFRTSNFTTDTWIYLLPI